MADLEGITRKPRGRATPTHGDRMPAARRRILAAAAALLVVSTAACGAPDLPAPPPAPAAPVGATAAADPATAPVLFPTVPTIVVPDVTALSAASSTFATALADLATPLSGISVADARCDGSGKIVNRAGLTQPVKGDGSGAFADGSLAVINNGNGSGTFTDAGKTITVNGDGSGTYNDANTTITINGDGSGTYSNAGMSIFLNGDGSGSYTAAGTSLTASSDGSGTYTDATTTITVNNNGSGSSNAAGRVIVDNGDGTGTVDGVDTAMAPAPLVPPIGKFPRADALVPVGQACGTLIRLDDDVLFDGDQAALRTDATAVLDKLGASLAQVTGAVQINAHTDSNGAAEDNLDLSRSRAAAVVTGLRQRGVPSAMKATGFGASQPIAPNELNGVDNPAGRQVNRRVEIVIPAS